MLVVKVELWSAITGKNEEIGRMYLANDGTALTPSRGNYDVKVCREGSFKYAGWDKIKASRSARVEEYPRLGYNVWRLVTRALKAAFHEES